MKKRFSLTIIILIVIAFAFFGCNKDNDKDFVPPNKQSLTQAKTITQIDENLNYNCPLNIDKIELTSKGDVILYPLGELKDNLGEEYTVANNIKDIYILSFGNGGYRSIIFIKTDGTLIALSAEAIINSNEIKYITDFGDIKDVTNVLQTSTSEAQSITAIDSQGNDYLLDYYLN